MSAIDIPAVAHRLPETPLRVSHGVSGVCCRYVIEMPGIAD